MEFQADIKKNSAEKIEVILSSDQETKWKWYSTYEDANISIIFLLSFGPKHVRKFKMEYINIKSI